MTFIVQRTRMRSVRRSGAQAALLTVATWQSLYPNATLPALNRGLRRELARHRRLVAAAALPAVLLAAIAVGNALPRSHEAAQTQTATAPVAGEAASTGGLTFPASPGFPAGVTTAQSQQPAPRVRAVLAADLSLAANAVYQQQTQAAVQAAIASTTHPPAVTGPTIEDLLRAQARLASAQLALLALQQRATDDQIAAAQAAVAQSQQALEQARAAAAAIPSPVATVQPTVAPTVDATVEATTAPTTAPVTAPTAAATAVPKTPTPQQLAAAQQGVDRAQAALDQVLHPYTDDQIVAARSELASAQQALADAQANAAAATAAPAPSAGAPAPDASTAPADDTSTALPVAATTSPEGQAAALAGAGSQAGTAGDTAAGAAALAGGAASGSARGNAAAAAALAGGSAQDNAPTNAAAAALAGGGSDAGAAPRAVATAASAPAAARQPAAAARPTVNATAVATQAPQAAARPATSRAVDPVYAARTRFQAAEETLAHYTAPPNPEAVQVAQANLQTAQQRLAALQAAMNPQASDAPTPAAVTAAATATRAATTAATPVPSATSARPSATATPAATPGTDVLTVDEAETRYQQAVTQLQWLTTRPDPTTIEAAQAEYDSAKQALDDLMAKADVSVKSQVDPDPQSALARLGLSGVGAGSVHPDVVPFVWPASGPITSYFGPSHPLGIDIGQGLGLPVRAAGSGVVAFSGGDPCCSYGYYIDIAHPGGYLTRYGHLLTPSFLKVGDPVIQGQIIGVSGSTGFSTGPHVHFEIRFNGVPLDPLRLLAGVLPQPVRGQ